MYTIKLNSEIKLDQLQQVKNFHGFLFGMLLNEEDLPLQVQAICINLYQQVDKILRDEISDEEYSAHITDVEKGAKAGSEIGQELFGNGEFEKKVMDKINKHNEEEH